MWCIHCDVEGREGGGKGREGRREGGRGGRGEGVCARIWEGGRKGEV